MCMFQLSVMMNSCRGNSSRKICKGCEQLDDTDSRGEYTLKTVRVTENGLRVTDDDSNDVQRGVGFWIIDAGSLMRNSILLQSVLLDFRFLLV